MKRDITWGLKLNLPSETLRDVPVHRCTTNHDQSSRLKRVTTLPTELIELADSKNFHGSQKAKQAQIQRQNGQLYHRVVKIMNRHQEKKRGFEGRSIGRRKNTLNDRKIMEENEGLLRRLLELKPTMSVHQMQEERVKNVSWLKMMGRYPYRKGASLGLQGCLNESKEDLEGTHETMMRGPDSSKLVGKEGGLRRHKSMRTEQVHLPRVGDSRQQEHQIVLWEGVVVIDGSYMSVKFLRFPDSYRLSAEVLHKEQRGRTKPKPLQSFHLQLPVEEGKTLLQGNDYSYSQICKHLTIQKQELFLTVKQASRNRKYKFEAYDLFMNKLKHQKDIPPISPQKKPQRGKCRKTVFARNNETEEVGSFTLQEIRHPSSSLERVITLASADGRPKMGWELKG